MSEQTKRAAQLSFVTPDDSLTAAHESVNNFYQQILTQGQVYQVGMDKDTTHQVIQGHFRELSVEMENYMEREQEHHSAFTSEDAEIDAAVAHDLKLIEEARQHWREQDTELDIEP